ncbi:amino acid ABC transporter membrane protein 2, PAAT family [Rhizobiales bacterium GAS191]|nr:amino acid ABC transporter membrane protein 2, PAAT family [Rhizobiales bacterium GAS188]SEE58501.1 amino acid ABC transporter membrane protein 2, PAAT family [Rhizobiales bacterium GAS191]
MSLTLGDLRRRFFGSLGNSLLTLFMLALFALVLPPLLRWALVDATFNVATPAQCREAGGACWAFVHEKYRLILFGRYPYAEQWRPLIAMFILITLILAACDRRLPRGWLTMSCTVGVPTAGVLMWGGAFGLEPVDTSRWGGLPLTLILAAAGIVIAFPLAVLLALGRRTEMAFVSALCTSFIEVMRGVPLVSLLFMASFMVPLFMPKHVQVDELLRALVAISLFSAAYLAEAIRGGLQAVPKGQEEAAHSLGLGPLQTSLLIVVPQALRIAIPAIVNIFIGLFKDTSLVGIVGLMDLLLAAKQALGDPAWRSFSLEAYLFVAALYFCFCFFMSRYSQSLERQVRTSEGNA